MGYKKSNQNQLGRVLPFAFALTGYKNTICTIAMFKSDASMLVMACLDCTRTCRKNPFQPPENSYLALRLKGIKQESHQDDR